MTEYMDHGSLRDLIHNETVVVEGDQLLSILVDVASGLRYLHSSNVVHGDIKAQNILVDKSKCSLHHILQTDTFVCPGFRAKVTDFALCQERALGASGTPYWMAPEILRAESSNTPQSDAYSFGIMLFE